MKTSSDDSRTMAGGRVGRVRGYLGHVSVSRSVGRFFFPPLSLSFFFIPADFFIRLEGRRPSVTKHCVLCRVGGGDESEWGEGGWVWGAVKQPDWKTVFGYF